MSITKPVRCVVLLRGYSCDVPRYLRTLVTIKDGVGVRANLNNTYQGVELCLINPYFHKLSIYFQYISIYVLSVLGWKFRRGLRRRVDKS